MFICLMSLRDIVLLLSEVVNSSEMAINQNLDDCEILQVFHLQKNKFENSGRTL